VAGWRGEDAGRLNGKASRELGWGLGWDLIWGAESSEVGSVGMGMRYVCLRLEEYGEGGFSRSDKQPESVMIGTQVV
jgi:hypothetical protein